MIVKKTFRYSNVFSTITYTIRNIIMESGINPVTEQFTGISLYLRESESNFVCHGCWIFSDQNPGEMFACHSDYGWFRFGILSKNMSPSDCRI